MNKKRLTLWLALMLALVLALPAAVQAEPVISNEVVITPVPDEPIDPEQPAEPGLALYASFSPEVSAPGGAVVLSVVLANTGTTLATGQIVTCVLPQGLELTAAEALSYESASRTITWNIELPAGQMATMTCDLRVDAGAPNGTVYPVTAACGEMSDQALVTVTDSDLRLSMTSTVKRAEPGDAVHYKITLENLGGANAPAVPLACLTDGMIVDLDKISHSGAYTLGRIDWTLDVPAHSKVTVDYLADVPEDALGGETYIAQATAAGLTATAPVTVLESEPILSISKKVNNRTPAPGTTIKYTIRVTNDGGADAHDVKIVDTLPEELDIYSRSITGGGDYDSYDGTITWYVDVPAHDSVALTFKAYVPDWAEDGEPYVNRARIKGGDSAKATLVVTEGAVPKTGYGEDGVVPAAWTLTPPSQDEAPARIEEIPDEPLPEVQESFRELFQQNGDLAGWLKVAEQVDLPIAQNESNDYYMTHSFDGQENEAGALFLDERNRISPRDQHLLIYGHNMKDGAMFGRLAQFRELDYLKANPTFTFQSIYDAEPTTYVVVAVLDASMDADNQDYLKIRVPNFDDEQAALDFMQSLKDFSYFNIPVEVNEQDHLMSLVTCSYLQDNGRLLVVGRALREGETAEQVAAQVQQSVKLK